MTQVNEKRDSKGRYLQDNINDIFDKYKNTTNFPDFIFSGNSNYHENIYDKMVDLCIIISELIKLDYLSMVQIAILINDYDDELATLRLISQPEHYKECELYMIYKIETTKEILLEYELYEALTNIKYFCKINNIINENDNTI